MKKMLLLPLLLASCAHAPCKPIEEVAKEKGLVLECYRFQMKDTREWVDQCLVMQQDGQVVEKIVYKRHCPLP